METLREGPPPAEASPNSAYQLNSAQAKESTSTRDQCEPTFPSEISKEPITPDEKKASTAFHPPVPSVASASQHVVAQQASAKIIPGKNLQSVVTTSFSVEDNTNSPSGRYHLSTERREPVDNSPPTRGWRPSKPAQRSPLPPPPHSIVVAAATPRDHANRHASGALSIARSYSSATADSFNSLPMKRNFFHHVGKNHSYMGLPPDFVPPKRVKAGAPHPPKGEVMLEARLESDSEVRSWYGIPPHHHWEMSLPPQYVERSGYPEERLPYSRSQSFPTPRWMEHTHEATAAPLKHHQRLPYNHGTRLMRDTQDVYADRHHAHPRSPSWYASYSSYAVPHHSRSQWRPGHPVVQQRDDIEVSQVRSVHREMRESFDEESRDSSTTSPGQSNRNAIFRNTSVAPSQYGNSHNKMQLVMEAASFTEGRSSLLGGSHSRTLAEDANRQTGTLLAMAEDRKSISEILCVIRENIEVFQASQADVDAPAPGRKHAVTVGQVGLRCIHCRHTKKPSLRVKRAVCYPSSLKRIYRTVIDMKLDHFPHCQFVPLSLKQYLDNLKSVHTRSTGTTMQYFIKSAMSLGMVDGPTGVRLTKSLVSSSAAVAPLNKLPTEKESRTTPKSNSEHKLNQEPEATKILKRPSGESSVSSMDISKRSDSMISGGSFDTIPHDMSLKSGQFYNGLVPLALPDDSSMLSPLRCFLREQVCAFSATENDLTTRSNTALFMEVGQVGIGCIHCMRKPAHLRSNRAACFPFSLGRIYQSVADIQRFHLGECKNLPSEIREKFLSLQSASSKGSKGLATRQYWIESAKKLGLVNTTKGLRFYRDPAKPLPSPSFSLDILAQAAISVTTTSKKLVLPEDKGTIAEFLYVVFEQLQPCRFTEADRNKRRLKDLGCIGVECKHCAGQVDGRKFFWSSVNAVESNFVSVHNHMFECPMVPNSLKATLTELKLQRKEQTAKLATGSQKAFFHRVWQRLHENESSGSIHTDTVMSGERLHEKESTTAIQADVTMSQDSEEGSLNVTEV